MKTPILVLCDDLWHPAEIIERGLKALKQNTYDFEVVKAAKDIITPQWIERFPMILCCKGNSVNQGNNAPWFEEGVSEVMPRDFDRYIRSGHGFLALHSGLTYSKMEEPYIKEYCTMTGSRFLGHPPRCKVDIRISDSGHPVAKGVETFSIRDEHYMMEMIAEDMEVFLTSTSEKGGTQVAGYTRHLGSGRFCALTPGHTLEAWEHPQFKRLLLNAIAWCVGSGC